MISQMRMARFKKKKIQIQIIDKICYRLILTTQPTPMYTETT